jgi:hypothetical protein
MCSGTLLHGGKVTQPTDTRRARGCLSARSLSYIRRPADTRNGGRKGFQSDLNWLPVFTAGLSGGAWRVARSLGHQVVKGSWRRTLERRRERVWGVVMAKVYVSSTIIDLKPEQQAVLDWLRLARHQAVDSYLPDSDTVRESCLDDVAACALYVLVVGHRYGFQPPEDDPEGLSITRPEFRRAGECGIPRQSGTTSSNSARMPSAYRCADLLLTISTASCIERTSCTDSTGYGTDSTGRAGITHRVVPRPVARRKPGTR